MVPMMRRSPLQTHPQQREQATILLQIRTQGKWRSPKGHCRNYEQRNRGIFGGRPTSSGAGMGSEIQAMVTNDRV
jgi:hypothetical protein